MDFFMRFCVSLLSIAVFFLTACGQETNDIYGFTINNVSVSRVYQSLNIRLQQDLKLSQQARGALEHGVKLTIGLEMELRNDNNMIVMRRDVRRFQLSYLPLSERYQLLDEETAELRTFPRLRHLLAAIDELSVDLSTGPLPTGSYELRTRIRLDESRLPVPMQLPAWFSSQWQHDSEWSVWPFKVSV
jgi:hypothetical protein